MHTASHPLSCIISGIDHLERCPGLEDAVEIRDFARDRFSLVRTSIVRRKRAEKTGLVVKAAARDSNSEPCTTILDTYWAREILPVMLGSLLFMLSVP